LEDDVTRRHVVLVTIGLAGLVLSTPLALIGRSVLATPAAVARVNAIWLGSAQVSRDRTLADRVAERLLAADRAEAFARIVAAYREATANPVLAVEPVNPVRLSKLIAALHSDDERAQAHVMVGAIFARPAGNGSVGVDAARRAGLGLLIDQAVEEFRAAVRVDEDNENAKYDLELLLKQQAISRAERQSNEEQRAQNKKPAQQRTKPRKRGQGDPSTKVELHAGIYDVGSGF
jgi:hypothetical protein